MGDVERWLVEKENERGGDNGEDTLNVNGSSPLEGTVTEMRDELMEVQGRIGELGREMAKFATSPGILSTMPSRVSAQAVSTAPQTNSSFAIHAQTSSAITVHSHSLPPNTPQASISRISSHTDLRRRESVSPPFIPPSAIRAEQPRSRLPYPTGDYTSPPGSVVVSQGALSPPQSPPTTSNSASGSPAGAVRPRPVSVAGLPAPSTPPPASAPAGLPPPRTGGTLAAPPQQPTRARSSSISPTPRKRYTVALGEPIMKPRVSASPPPISVADDDDYDDGANDAGEEDSVERTIGRSAGRQTPAQHKKGQRSNGVGLGFGFGLGLGMGNGTGGEDTDTSLDSAPRSPRPPRPRVHPRMASRSPSSAQSMAANANANATGGSRMNTQRLLGHGRSLSIDRAAANAAAPRTKSRSSTTTTMTKPSTPSSAGFRDPLVVRREETVARARAVPPPPRVVTGKPRAPVGELVAYFDKS